MVNLEMRRKMHLQLYMFKQKTNVTIVNNRHICFLLVGNNSDLDDLQILQNNVLRICNMSKVSDKISWIILHTKCKMLA